MLVTSYDFYALTERQELTHNKSDWKLSTFAEGAGDTGTGGFFTKEELLAFAGLLSAREEC